MKNVVSIPKAADMLQVTEKTIRNYIKKRFLNPTKWNGMWQIQVSEIRELYRKKNVKPNKGIDDFWAPFGFDLSKEEFASQMIGLGKLEAYEAQLNEQKQEIDKLNTRILQLEASCASGWTEARSTQQTLKETLEELKELRANQGEQAEEVAWLRKEKDGLLDQLQDRDRMNRRLKLKLKSLEDELYAKAILG